MCEEFLSHILQARMIEFSIDVAAERKRWLLDEGCTFAIFNLSEEDYIKYQPI
jgi:hypothetical protein